MTDEGPVAVGPSTDDDGPVADEQPRGPHRLPTVLVVVATVLAVISAVTTWVRVQALDTDEWVEASAELLAEPEVQETLATYLVDELYQNVDVSASLGSVLPDELSGVAGPLAGALKGPATEGIERVLDRPRLQQAWEAANRLAHETLVAIVRDDVGENVSTADGAVVLDLAGAVEAVGEELGLPGTVLERLPADAGQVVVFESDELADVQDAVRVLDALSWFLFVVVVGLYVLAVYLARDRRREMLCNVGASLAIGGIALLALRTIGVRWTVDQIVEVPAYRPTAQLVGGVLTALLSDMAWTAIVVGVVIVGYAALLGPHSWAVAARRRLAASSNPSAIVVGAGVVILVVVAWWSPGMMFERWVTALTATGLILGATVVLARALRDEQPEQSTG